MQLGKEEMSMACLMNDLAVLLLIIGGFVSGQEELAVGKYDNIEPFGLLCRIYNVAKNPPINYVDLQEPRKIVEEIYALNFSLMEPKLLNETEQMGNSVGAQLPHTTSREAALLQTSLNQITQRAHTILEEIKKINVEEKIEKTKAHFAQVIFGENGNESELCQATVKDTVDRAKACGKPGEGTKGESAGNNLVVDFFCLCAQRTDGAGVNQVCGLYVGGNRENGQLGWSETQGPEGSSTMWASIKGGCGKHMHQHPKSTAEARHILDQFLKHLKTGGVYRWGDVKAIKGSERKPGMLGTGVGTKEGGGETGPVCNGKNGKGGKTPAGICVYYGQESEWEDSINWMKPFKTALVSVDAVNRQTATIQRDIKKLQMLLHHAEEIYETTKVISEVQNTVGLTTLQNASGNLTAYNATRTHNYSYSPHLCFIPALALLLIL